MEYARAAWTGDLSTLERMWHLGCPMPSCSCCGADVFTKAVHRESRSPYRSKPYEAPLPALRWLLDAGVLVDWDEALGAARKRQGDAAEVEEWLMAQREQRAGVAASKRQRLERLG